jgi:Ras-related protein Rab-7A
LVYDITNARSFENLNLWRQDFLVKANPKDPDNFPFFVFGNKADKAAERKVFANFSCFNNPIDCCRSL